MFLLSCISILQLNSRGKEILRKHRLFQKRIIIEITIFLISLDAKYQLVYNKGV